MREAMHASAPRGHGCADCAMDGEACPTCYAAWWKARHPHVTQHGGEVVEKLWLWKNFVDGRPEYWAFDNAFPINLTDGDPQTLGEPCGYAIFKPSRQGRTDVSEEQVLRRIAGAAPSNGAAQPQ